MCIKNDPIPYKRSGALYIRVSTDKQEELSPDAQKRLLLDYAGKNGIRIDPDYIYMENGISGKRADKRPAFQKMIAAAKMKPTPFDVILVWKFSRFARNQDESVFYKSILRKKCNVDVVSITEPIIEGMYGRLIEMIIEWNDEFYSYNLSQEVKRGMEEKALRGGYQSAPCLGYAAVGDGKPFVIIEEEYKIYQYIADQYDFQYQDPTAIARKVNAMGWKTKRGNPFEARTVTRLLRNPFYAGTVSWNGHEFKGIHETRISPERFQKRIKRMDSMYTPKSRRNISACRHWLGGLVKCPICQASLGFNNSASPGTPPFFSCWRYAKGFHGTSVSISEKKLVQSVYQNFEDLLSGKDFTVNYLPSKTDSRPDLALLHQELNQLEKREKRIKLAYEKEVDTLEEYKENKMRLGEERERLVLQIKQLETRIPKALGKEDVLKKVSNVYELIRDPDVDFETKGTFMRSVVESIVYDKENNQLIFYWHTN